MIGLLHVALFIGIVYDTSRDTPNTILKQSAALSTLPGAALGSSWFEPSRRAANQTYAHPYFNTPSISRMDFIYAH